VFLSDARRIVAMAGEAIARVRQFDLGEEGSVRVGFTSSASMHPLTLSILERFRRDYPLVSLKIEEGANHDLLYLLEQERIDVAFVRSATNRYPALTSRVVTTEPMLVALHAGDELGAQEQIDLATLVERNLILYRQANGSGIGDMLMAALQSQGLAPRIVEEPQRIMAALNLVAAGFGVTVVPASMHAVQLPSIIYRPLAGPGNFTVPLNVAHRKHIDAEAIKRFLRIIEAESSQAALNSAASGAPR
jgi:DNA-binding transcriptional LysR family regulator